MCIWTLTISPGSTQWEASTPGRDISAAATRWLVLMRGSRTYTLWGRHADGSDQQQDKGQGLAQSQLPGDRERNKHVGQSVTNTLAASRGLNTGTHDHKVDTAEVFEKTEKAPRGNRKKKTRLTLQTAEVFRSLIISTNKLPHNCDPLWAGAKVRNAPPSSKYH